MLFVVEYEKENPYNIRRRESAEYANVLVVNGHFSGGMKKWYWMLEGEELFCKVRKDSNNQIREFYPCRLTETKIHIGRSLDARDCLMV